MKDLVLVVDDDPDVLEGRKKPQRKKKEKSQAKIEKNKKKHRKNIVCLFVRTSENVTDYFHGK